MCQIWGTFQCIIIVLIGVIYPQVTLAAIVPVEENERRAELFIQLESLVKLLTSLQLQMTQNASPLASQSVPPYLLPAVPSPVVLDGVSGAI